MCTLFPFGTGYKRQESSTYTCCYGRTRTYLMESSERALRAVDVHDDGNDRDYNDLDL
jgi:hypothetical protein